MAARKANAIAIAERKIKAKVWKFDYMIKRKQKKVAECLGLESTDTGKRITGKLEKYFRLGISFSTKKYSKDTTRENP